MAARQVAQASAVLLALTVACIAVLSGYAGALTHILEHRPGWVSTKPQLGRAVWGAMAYISSPYALHGGRLNLAAWHGYQEVYYEQPLAPQQVRFAPSFSPGSYIEFLFNRTDDGFSGIRFEPGRRLLRFRADPERRFIRRQPISAAPLTGNAGRVHVAFDGERVDVVVDGRSVANFREPQSERQQIGFRGSWRESWIDDVEICQVGDRPCFEDDFELQPPWWAPLTLTVVLGSLAWFAIRGLRSGRSRRRFLWLALIELTLLIVGGVLLSYDRLILSGNYDYSSFYFNQRNAWLGRVSPIEGEQEVSERIHAVTAAAGHGARVMVVGTSQTWGAGASNAELDLVRRLEHKLTERRAADPGPICLSAAVSGYRSEHLLELYADDWIRHRPRLTLINLGNNDGDPALLAANLEQFVSLNREHGIDTVLVLEPNHEDGERLAANHAATIDVGQRLGVPVLDLHGYLLERRDQGMLWWDHVHLTDYGQELAATFLERELSGLLETRSADR